MNESKVKFGLLQHRLREAEEAESVAKDAERMAQALLATVGDQYKQRDEAIAILWPFIVGDQTIGAQFLAVVGPNTRRSPPYDDLVSDAVEQASRALLANAKANAQKATAAGSGAGGATEVERLQV